MTWVTIKGGQHNLSSLQVRAWVSCYIFTVEIRTFFFSVKFFIKKIGVFFPLKKKKIVKLTLEKHNYPKFSQIFCRIIFINFFDEEVVEISGWI